MHAFLKKSTAVALTALVLGLGVAATTSTEASAQQRVWHQGGYYGGHWRNGWWGPAVGLGILGGLAAGAVIASSQGPAYGPGPYYGPGPGPNSCMAYQPVYDGWGRYLGRRWVDVCQ